MLRSMLSIPRRPRTQIVDAPYHSTLCSTCRTVCHDRCGLTGITTPGKPDALHHLSTTYVRYLCLLSVSSLQSARSWALRLIFRLLSASACIYQPLQEVVGLQHTLMIPGAAGFGFCSCIGLSGNGRCRVCTGHCGVSSHYHARKTIKEVGAKISQAAIQ